MLEVQGYRLYDKNLEVEGDFEEKLQELLVGVESDFIFVQTYDSAHDKFDGFDVGLTNVDYRDYINIINIDYRNENYIPLHVFSLVKIGKYKESYVHNYIGLNDKVTVLPLCIGKRNGNWKMSYKAARRIIGLKKNNLKLPYIENIASNINEYTAKEKFKLYMHINRRNKMHKFNFDLGRVELVTAKVIWRLYAYYYRFIKQAFRNKS